MIKITASPVFRDIEIDERVNQNLKSCLYCYVRSNDAVGPVGQVLATNYKIPLTEISIGFKKCPSCQRLYVTSPI